MRRHAANLVAGVGGALCSRIPPITCLGSGACVQWVSCCAPEICCPATPANAHAAVTQGAIKDALANPRQISEPLVQAYMARRWGGAAVGGWWAWRWAYSSAPASGTDPPPPPSDCIRAPAAWRIAVAKLPHLHPCSRTQGPGLPVWLPPFAHAVAQSARRPLRWPCAGARHSCPACRGVALAPAAGVPARCSLAGQLPGSQCAACTV